MSTLKTPGALRLLLRDAEAAFAAAHFQRQMNCRLLFMPRRRLPRRYLGKVQTRGVSKPHARSPWSWWGCSSAWASSLLSQCNL